jgi:putative hemolysin
MLSRSSRALPLIKLWNFPEEIIKIPENGSVVLASNCPLDGNEAQVIHQVVSKRHARTRVLLLPNQEPIEGVHVPAHTWREENKYQQMREVLAHLENDGALIVFPAGKGSLYNDSTGDLEEYPWDVRQAKWLLTKNYALIPLWVQVRKKAWHKRFYLGSNKSKNQRSVLGLQLRIGKSIGANVYQQLTPIDLSNKIFKQAKLLSHALPPHISEFKINFLPTKKNRIKPLAPAVSNTLIVAEIERLKQLNKIYVQSSVYEVFLATWSDIPNTIKEIGRLRELTFRLVGEGTMEPYDLDGYDKIYRHLICWDNQEKQIVGAYRLGLGKEIYSLYGIRGFYVPTLFKVKGPAKKLFTEGIEMGRAFIVPEYQQKPLPLFLLWKGIVKVWNAHADHKYLVGCVSISNSYSKFSRALLMRYILDNHYNHEMASHIVPRNPAQEEVDNSAVIELCNEISQDVKKLDNLISDIEPNGLKVPVLLKKYIRQNAQIAAFNIDYSFNKTLDGLMFIDMNDMPLDMLKNLLD